jgi:hypothetical protein
MGRKWVVDVRMMRYGKNALVVVAACAVVVPIGPRWRNSITMKWVGDVVEVLKNNDRVVVVQVWSRITA